VEFAYDADGRRVRQTDSHGGTNEFTHDAAGRVTRIQATPGIDLQYVYDAAGRLLSETREVPKPAGALLVAGAETNEYDAAAQLATPAAAYDALGRRTADERRAYQWSPDGLLTNAGGVSVAYDAFGNVTARNGQPLACHPAIGGAPLVDDGTNWYVWTPGGALLYVVAQAEGHAVHHYRFDGSGHAIALVDTNGTVAEAYAYTPGGLELDPVASALGNPFRFHGRHGIRAEGTGDLYHVRARWYDARTRAFLSKEPLWPRTANPHALNPYQYANADPVNFADVDGRHEVAKNDLWKYNTNDGTWGEVDDVVPGKPAEERGGLEIADNDLGKYNKKDGTWREVDDVVPGKPAEERGGAVAADNDLWKYNKKDGTWGGVPDDVPGKPAEERGGAVAAKNDLWKYNKKDGTWGGIDPLRNTWTPTKTVVKPLSHDEIKARFGDAFLALLTGTTVLEGIVDSAVEQEKWQKQQYLWEKGHDRQVNKGPGPLSPLAPPDPVKALEGIDPTGVEFDWWHKHSGSREQRLQEIVAGGGNAPQKKAAAAVATHLGRGVKRQMLADKIVEHLGKGKKKEIKLSGDWEGGDGSLDVKPFHLGKQGY